MAFVMKKFFIILVLVIISVLLGIGWYWQRSQRFSRRLVQARESVGTKQGDELLQGLAQAYPDQPEVAFLETRQLRLEGHTDLGLARCQRAAELGYRADQVAREMLLLRAQKEFRLVEPELQRLLDTDPYDDDVLLALALGWSQLRTFAKAEALVNGILHRDPSGGAALWVRGKIKLQKHQPHDARPDLEKAVASGLDKYYYPRARYLLANCYLELGKFEDALQLFRQCLADEPESPRLLFGVGRCCWFLNRWDEAQDAFQQVLSQRPDHLDALSQLAYIHEERGELPQALELLERAAKQDPSWYDLHFRMSKILNALGQTQRAGEHLQRAEQVKKAWAKPRTNPFTGRNPYSGDEPGALRNPLDD